MKLEQYQVALRIGREVAFDIATDSDRPPSFVLGFRKSGSSLLNMLCAELQRLNGRHSVDIAGTFFRHNIIVREWDQDPAWLALIQPGNMYHGFRMMPRLAYEHPLFTAAPKVLMVRDPRDALVSQYFSSGFSHSIPATTGNADGVTEMMLREREHALTSPIDDFVLRHADSFRWQMSFYDRVHDTPNLLLLRYEDWIFRKGALIRRLADHFNLEVSDETIGHMLGWSDIRPEIENPREFVRRVTPGDHLGKLAPATIEQLNLVLRPVLDAYDYPDHAYAVA